MLSGERERSRLAAHSSPLPALAASVAMPGTSRILMSLYGGVTVYEIGVPPSITTYECVREIVNKRKDKAKKEK